MTVVADASPINYLVLIGEIDVLPRLYGRVTIPLEVLAEIRHPRAPLAVREWATDPPDWLDPKEANSQDPKLGHLDSGEIAAIALAEAASDSLLLIDDAAGRAEAVRRGIQTLGTLGILQQAAQGGLVDLPLALKRLVETNFRVSRALLADLTQ